MISTLIALLAVYNAAANPIGPNSIQTLNSTYKTYPSTGSDLQAEAGNVTLLIISDLRTTHRWQGYYGNITGGITLQDAVGNVLFDWYLARPQGEIYASNTSTVSWATIKCFNMTASATDQQVTLDILESTLGIATTDKDGVNETFNNTFAGSFRVGATTINSASGCSSAYMFVNNTEQYTNFVETILTDNSTTGNVIFTALLEDDKFGYDYREYDFELIVGANGDLPTTTPYYFFVELE